MAEAELLAAYKWQPNLEKRHAQLKGTQLVAPVFVHDPARIEGLLCCHFIALLVQALTERQTGKPWATAASASCLSAPRTASAPPPPPRGYLDVFTDLARHHLIDEHGRLVQTFQPELNPV
jgi:hypothetical protein